MKNIRITLLSLLLVSLLLSVTGCMATPASVPSEPLAEKSLGSFPYHPLVYHLDLSILAYQLYSQTLVWPFDPYYEEMNSPSGGRATFMRKVRKWARKQGAELSGPDDGLNAYRGPGELGGFKDNQRHDPILYQYGRLHPWSEKTVFNPAGKWTEYMTPKEITSSIRDVYMCSRPTGGREKEVVVQKVLPRGDDSAPNGSDVLLAFEGETGDKGEEGQPGSQSLMGFVLLRTTAGASYDVHIAFRGTKSGRFLRGIQDAMSDRHASGNPDWITDMGYNRLTAANDEDDVRDIITTTGAVFRGQAHSMKSILPNLFHCLDEAANIKRGTRPGNIYVTGHSLGGALAQHFVSAVLLGNQYGPGDAGEQMPAALRGWPWKQIKLITYSSPRVGDAEWARTLTKSGLESEFFSTIFYSYDTKALAPTDPGIVSRLLDTERPAGYRVLISKDPATTEKVISGKHVGKTVYVNDSSFWDMFSLPSPAAHEPSEVRKYMVDSLDDLRIPANDTRCCIPMKHGKDLSKKGTTKELRNLADEVKRYYSENKIWFDQAAFDRNVELRFSIDRSE